MGKKLCYEIVFFLQPKKTDMNAQEFLIKHGLDDLILNEMAFPKNMEERVYASDIMEMYAEQKLKDLLGDALKSINCRKCQKNACCVLSDPRGDSGIK